MKRNRNEEVDTKIDIDNHKQAKVIAKLKQVLNFLEGNQIKSEDSIAKIDKPVDELLSSLKYLPVDQNFDLLPTEIKTDILSNLCDNGAYIAASVCREWRGILEPRLVKLDEVSIGKRCTNKYSCEDGACLMPEEILKASIAMRMDVRLSIHHPVTELDTNLLVEGFKSVSRIRIFGRCEDETYELGPTLTNNQIEHLFEGLEENVENISVLLLNGVVMTHLDQNRLMNFLLKTKSLVLKEDHHHKMLNVQMFVEKITHNSGNFRLSHLELGYFDLPMNIDFPEQLAKALCQVKSVNLVLSFPQNYAIIKHLIVNIRTKKVLIKCLKIAIQYDWIQLVSSEDLKTMISKMKSLFLVGEFTLDQIEAARSLPGVETKQLANKGFMILSGIEEVAPNWYRNK